MTKATSINLRITREFRAELEALAEYHGLTLSSYAHSLLVKAVRREKEEAPEAFQDAIKNFVQAMQDLKETQNPKHKAPVVAKIEPSYGMTKKEIQQMIDEQGEVTTKTQTIGVAKRKAR